MEPTTNTSRVVPAGYLSTMMVRLDLKRDGCGQVVALQVDFVRCWDALLIIRSNGSLSCCSGISAMSARGSISETPSGRDHNPPTTRFQAGLTGRLPPNPCDGFDPAR